MKYIYILLIIFLSGCVPVKQELQVVESKYPLLERALTCSEFKDNEYGDLLDFVNTLHKTNIVTPDGSNKKYHFKVIEPFKIFNLTPIYIGHGIFDIIGTYATFNINVKKLKTAIENYGMKLTKTTSEQGDVYYLGDRKGDWQLAVLPLHKDLRGIGKSMIQCSYFGP